MKVFLFKKQFFITSALILTCGCYAQNTQQKESPVGDKKVFALQNSDNTQAAPEVTETSLQQKNIQNEGEEKKIPENTSTVLQSYLNTKSNNCQMGSTDGQTKNVVVPEEERLKKKPE